MEFIRFGKLGRLGGLGAGGGSLLKWILTITKTGNGTVDPDVGSHKYAKESNVTVTATETDDDYYFEKFVEDGVDKTDNPLTVTMSANKEVDAVFIELTEILNTFGIKPEYYQGDFYWPDASGFSNRLKISNCNSLYFDGITGKAIVAHDASQLIGTGQYSLHIKGRIGDTNANIGTICGKRHGSLLTYLLLQYVPSTKQISFLEQSGSGLLIENVNLGDNFNVTITRGNGNVKLYNKDSYVNQVVRTNLDIQVPTQFTIGAYTSGISYLPLQMDVFECSLYSRELSASEVADLAQGKILSDTTGLIFHHFYGLGVGSTVYDLSGNNRVATASGTYSWRNEGNYPYHYLHGFTLSGSKIVPAKLSLASDADGNAIQYPSGYGIVNGLADLYTVPTNTDLNSKIPAGDKTWSNIDGLTESKYLLKTKSGSKITSLIVKKKMSESLQSYSRNTNYSRTTSYTR
jgi:hypothetical protein